MSRGRGWPRRARPPDSLASALCSVALVMPRDGTISPDAAYAVRDTRSASKKGRMAPERRRPKVARVIMRLRMKGLLHRERFKKRFTRTKRSGLAWLTLHVLGQ